ncbi:hypothetical protein Vretimale_1168 [Volvox reticuliferus]|uniref:K Homology domain-containing protein n=1 Tax=Volvox reticuliferus TaxID=1737510 RepID=A0A8J4CK34_9CHLO|nr:hypothetical protein Vretifemale_10317 [Volvox reticuliferus]GIL95080.1 hypothetical protein Vretimale_1168 [Volvox reticuliferus]
MRTQNSVMECPRSMVGRVIGKNGETVKALQTYTGATIQIDQSVDPTRVSISGAAYSVNLAVSIVTDIIRGSFKGFALLRQATRPANGRNGYPAFTEPRPVYAPGYGLIPASQLYDDRAAAPPPPMGPPFSLRPADSLQHVYPLMTTGLPTQNVLALQPDAALAQPGTMSLVNAQLQQLAIPAMAAHAGDLGALAGGAMPYQEAAYMPVLPMAGGGAPAGPGGATLQMGASEEFAMSASHRLIQAAGGSRGAVRPKGWLG